MKPWVRWLYRKQWEMISNLLLPQCDDLSNSELIGRGGFGSVFKVFNQMDNRHYAIKRVRVTEENIPNALTEIRILASVAHPYVIRYHHSWVSSERICGAPDSSDDDDDDDAIMVHQGDRYFFNIQMEYCMSNLRRYLYERTDHDPVTATTIVQQLVEGICFLHGNCIIHRDLKPDNILISSFCPFHIKITDFGLAKRVVGCHQDASSYAGTLLYAAPEQIESKKYYYASDVYSIGIMMVELQYVFATDMERVLFLEKFRKTRGASSCLYLASLIMSMTEPDHERRPTIFMVQNRHFRPVPENDAMCRDIVWSIISSVLDRAAGGPPQQHPRVHPALRRLHST